MWTIDSKLSIHLKEVVRHYVIALSQLSIDGPLGALNSEAAFGCSKLGCCQTLNTCLGYPSPS